MGTAQLANMQAAVRSLLKAVGEDVDREGLIDTPKRVAKALIDVSAGYRQCPTSVLGDALFNEPAVKDGGESIVIVRDVDFASTSESTLLPFHGRCHIGYVPSRGVVLGLSKLARLTKVFAKRLQSQESLGADIAAALQRHLACSGVAVAIEAKHLAMARAAPPPTRTTVTTCGVFAEQGSSQLQELLCMLDLDVAPNAIHSVPDHMLHGKPASAHGGRMALQLASMQGGPGLLAGEEGVPAPATPDPSERDSEKDSSEASDEQDSEPERVGTPDLQICISSTQDDELRPDCHDGCSPTSCGSDTRNLGAHVGAALLLPGAPAAPGTAEVQQQQQQQRSCGASAADLMEIAARSLLQEMLGQDPVALGLHNTARAYVTSLLASTSGYAKQLPSLPPTSHHQLSSSSVSQPASGHHASTCPCCAQRGGASPAATSSSSLQQPGTIVSGSCQRGTIRAARFAFTSQCEHHMLPFYGTVDVAYVDTQQPATLGSGASSSGPADALHDEVARVVAAATMRLQVQERITQQVASAVEALLAQQQQPQLQHQREGAVSSQGAASSGSASAAGVLVLVDAAHMCMVARGVENHAGRTTSTAARGAAAADAGLRAQLLRACKALTGDGAQPGL